MKLSTLWNYGHDWIFKLLYWAVEPEPDPKQFWIPGAGRVEQIIQWLLVSVDQIVLKPESKTSRYWSQELETMPWAGAGAWNLSFSSKALIDNFQIAVMHCNLATSGGTCKISAKSSLIICIKLHDNLQKSDRILWAQIFSITEHKIGHNRAYLVF